MAHDTVVIVVVRTAHPSALILLRTVSPSSFAVSRCSYLPRDRQSLQNRASSSRDVLVLLCCRARNYVDIPAKPPSLPQGIGHALPVDEVLRSLCEAILLCCARTAFHFLRLGTACVPCGESFFVDAGFRATLSQASLGAPKIVVMEDCFWGVTINFQTPHHTAHPTAHHTTNIAHQTTTCHHTLPETTAQPHHQTRLHSISPRQEIELPEIAAALEGCVHHLNMLTSLQPPLLCFSCHYLLPRFCREPRRYEEDGGKRTATVQNAGMRSTRLACVAFSGYTSVTLLSTTRLGRAR